MESEKMVVTKLQGGLGNQLFQMCAGLWLANEFGVEVVFDQSSVEFNELNETLGLGVVSAQTSVLKQVAFGSSDSFFGTVVMRARRELLLKRGTLQLISQKSGEAFLERPTNCVSGRSKFIYLSGFFQHPSWLNDSFDEVAGRMVHSLRSVSSPENTENGTVISFRRGDYVRYGWDLPMSYYDSAIRLLAPCDGPIWIVGDDMLVTELMSERLRTQGLNVHSLPDLGVSNIQRDLVLLMRSKQVVMSNSTFCWWGVKAGNLTGGKERRIIAPSRWLPLKGSNSLLESAWVTVGF